MVAVLEQRNEITALALDAGQKVGGEVKEPKQVHLRDLDGNVKYNMLLDDGGPFLPFGGLYPYGFIDRMRLKREGLVVHEGWLTQEELETQRMRSPKAKLWLEYATPSERKTLQAALDKLESVSKTATA